MRSPRCTACAKEPRSSGVECNAGGKFHPKLNTCSISTVDKYHEEKTSLPIPCARSTEYRSAMSRSTLLGQIRKESYPAGAYSASAWQPVPEQVAPSIRASRAHVLVSFRAPHAPSPRLDECGLFGIGEFGRAHAFGG